MPGGDKTMLKLSVLLIPAGMAFAQQAPGPDQQQVAAQMRGMEANLQSLKAQEAALQARLDELKKTRTDLNPDVVALKNKLRKLEASNAALSDRWWRNPAAAQSLGLTADQQKKMDDVFQQYRLKLIDLNANLEREEITLDPMLSAEPLDEARITAQIDRVAQARAELEKANGRMLLGIRKLLTPDQWSMLNERYSLVPGSKLGK